MVFRMFIESYHILGILKTYALPVIYFHYMLPKYGAH